MELVTAEPINPAAMYDLLATRTAGSVLLHYAVVKEHHVKGKTTIAIVYEPAGDIKENLASIGADLCSRWNLQDTLLVRRSGRVGIGEIISLVAVSATASEDAFAACKFAIECLKKMPTIKKSEVFECASEAGA